MPQQRTDSYVIPSGIEESLTVTLGRRMGRTSRDVSTALRHDKFNQTAPQLRGRPIVRVRGLNK
jgi:hypothetical protein